MRTTTKDLTAGNLYGQILTFALPILLSQLFQQLYNTADSLIVGHYLGTDALAAVSSSGTLIFLLVSFFNGLAMGAGIVISRYFGAGDEDRVSRAIHTNLVFGVICGVVLTVVGVAFTPAMLRLMRTDPDVLPGAIVYFRYYFLGSLALILYNICRGIMNALGDSRRPLYYLIVSSLLNIFLDWLFIAVFHMGVGSAAVATVISQFVSVLLCMLYLCRPGQIFSVVWRKLRISRDMLGEIVRYGFPSGVQNSVIAFANVLVQTQINTFGKFATAAYGTHAKLEGFAFLPIMSFNMATTTFVSQNLGAGLHDRAKRGATFGILLSVITAQLIGIFSYCNAEWLVSLFDDAPQVIEYGALQAHTVTLFYFLLAFSHAVAAVCRGAGKAFVPMFVMLSVWCALRIVYIEAVCYFTDNIQLIYWAYPITWLISSVIYFIYYRCSDWVHGFDNEKKKA